jgi:hypothetical protein
MQKMKFVIIITAVIMAINLSMVINHNSVPLYQFSNLSGQFEFQISDGKDPLVHENTQYMYIGAEKCASVCHNNDTMGFQYNIWNGSPHRNAYKILDSKKAESYARKANIAENPQESQTCLKCHTTGGGLDFSFFTATYKKEEGVTCEACHKQISDGKTYLPNEVDCLQCHNNSLHKIQKFNFTEGSAKIAHPRPREILPKNTAAGQAQ